jgi:hypothetical protein
VPRLLLPTRYRCADILIVSLVPPRDPKQEIASARSSFRPEAAIHPPASHRRWGRASPSTPMLWRYSKGWGAKSMWWGRRRFAWRIGKAHFRRRSPGAQALDRLASVGGCTSSVRWDLKLRTYESCGESIATEDEHKQVPASIQQLESDKNAEKAHSSDLF